MWWIAVLLTSIPYLPIFIYELQSERKKSKSTQTNWMYFLFVFWNWLFCAVINIQHQDSFISWNQQALLLITSVVCIICIQFGNQNIRDVRDHKIDIFKMCSPSTFSFKYHMHTFKVLLWKHDLLNPYTFATHVFHFDLYWLSVWIDLSVVTKMWCNALSIQYVFNLFLLGFFSSDFIIPPCFTNTKNSNNLFTFRCIYFKNKTQVIIDYNSSSSYKIGLIKLKVEGLQVFDHDMFTWI